ncbi:MAG: hypothetical protein WBA74_16950 [Cyclobacteriaceae bacterium]
MKMVLLTGFVFLTLSVDAKVYDPTRLRKCFHASVIDESLVDDFHEKVMKIRNPTALQLAYQGASYALLAKKTWNPIEKISLINRYAKLIDKAIEKSPKNIEIRFLRLSIDYYTPVLLGRKSNVSDDKSLILLLLSSIPKFDVDSSFNKFILYFLKHEAIYSADELALVASKLN